MFAAEMYPEREFVSPSRSVSLSLSAARLKGGVDPEECDGSLRSRQTCGTWLESAGRGTPTSDRPSPPSALWLPQPLSVFELQSDRAEISFSLLRVLGSGFKAEAAAQRRGGRPRRPLRLPSGCLFDGAPGTE